MKIFENLFGKAGANIADGFVSIGSCVIAGEKEGTVNRRTFTFAVVGAEDYQIKRVTYSRKVIFLDLSLC